MRRFTDIHGTQGMPDVPLRAPLPFAPARPVPSRLATTGDLPPLPLRPALPFASSDDAGVEALAQSVERYASLCVDLERAPGQAAETLARYRLTAEQKVTLDERWRAKMSDTETRARWDEACKVYRAWLAKGSP